MKLVGYQQSICLCVKIEFMVGTSGGSRQGVWGGQLNTPKSIHLFKYPSFSATIVGYHTKVVTFFRSRKWLFLLVELCDLSGITKV